MTLTRDFRQTVRERALRDEGYRKGLLLEAVNEILEGNSAAGKAMLRDYVNAAITFTELGKRLNKSSKSIHRMLGPEGNPRMDSIVGILKVLQDEEHIRLRAEFGIDAIRIPNRCEVKRELASGPPHRDIESFGKRAKRRFNFEDE